MPHKHTPPPTQMFTTRESTRNGASYITGPCRNNGGGMYQHFECRTSCQSILQRSCFHCNSAIQIQTSHFCFNQTRRADTVFVRRPAYCAEGWRALCWLREVFLTIAIVFHSAGCRLSKISAVPIDGSLLVNTPMQGQFIEDYMQINKSVMEKQIALSRIIIIIYKIYNNAFIPRIQTYAHAPHS